MPSNKTHTDAKHTHTHTLVHFNRKKLFQGEFFSINGLLMLATLFIPAWQKLGKDCKENSLKGKLRTLVFEHWSWAASGLCLSVFLQRRTTSSALCAIKLIRFRFCGHKLWAVWCWTTLRCETKARWMQNMTFRCENWQKHSDGSSSRSHRCPHLMAACPHDLMTDFWRESIRLQLWPYSWLVIPPTVLPNVLGIHDYIST